MRVHGLLPVAHLLCVHFCDGFFILSPGAYPFFPLPSLSGGNGGLDRKIKERKSTLCARTFRTCMPTTLKRTRVV